MAALLVWGWPAETNLEVPRCTRLNPGAASPLARTLALAPASPLARTLALAPAPGGPNGPFSPRAYVGRRGEPRESESKSEIWVVSPVMFL